MKKTFRMITIISALSCAASLLIGEEKRIVMDGSTTVGPIAKAFAEYFREIHPDTNVLVSESGSGNGVKSLMNGSCDIANLSRFMKEAEFKSCVNKGILPVAHVVAFDGLAIIVNPDNVVSSLTLRQISDIYTGKINNWKDVGGEDAKIVIVSRDTNSGTFESFSETVLKKKPVCSSAEYVGSNGQARSRVASTKYAIAYVGLGFSHAGVKALSVERILPEAQSISSGKYPIARPLFMFTNGYPRMGTALYEFVNLFLSKDGREIISDLGFVPVCE